MILKDELDRRMRGPGCMELLVILLLIAAGVGTMAWFLFKAADSYLTIHGVPH